MMKLIVGLGNPEEEFENTRHNAGFLVVDQLARNGNIADKSATSNRSSKFTCDLLFAKPQTGMNASGAAVKEIVDREEIELDNFLLIHDDLDLPLGDFKLQKGRGAAGHRGVRSVIDALGSKEFFRLRVGIGKPPEGEAAEDYVLGKFGPDELEVLGRLVESELVEVVREWVEQNNPINQ